jgi:hypothetical protein
MLERLKQLYTRADEQEAIRLLCDPSDYPALPAQDSCGITIQLYVLPSFQPTMTWTLYRRPDSTFVLRRVRWDFIADYQMTRRGLTVSAPTTYGADAICPPSLVSPALDELTSLSVPAYDPASSFGIDGVSFGFRRSSFSQSLEFSWWCHPPKGCEALADWYHRFTAELEDLLPAHTDHFRLSAIRP